MRKQDERRWQSGLLFVFHDDGESIKFPNLARDDARFGINRVDERNE